MALADTERVSAIEGDGIEEETTTSQSLNNTPLWLLAKNGSEARLVQQLAKFPESRHRSLIDVSDDQGRTPLWWAAWNGHVGIVKYLLTKESELYHHDSEHFYKPLHIAAQLGHADITKLLLESENPIQTASREKNKHHCIWPSRADTKK
jgi:ankyrin repeat protein